MFLGASASTTERQGVIVAVLVLFSGLSAHIVAGELPLQESFEDRSSGVLHAQQGWWASPADRVQVQSEETHHGTHAAIVETNSMMRQSFTDNSATNVWVDFYASFDPREGTEPSLSDDAVAGFYFNSSSNVVARSNETWVVISGAEFAANAWYRFSVNLDYNNRRWAIYYCGSTPNTLATPLATNLAFAAEGTNTYFHSFRVKN